MNKFWGWELESGMNVIVIHEGVPSQETIVEVRPGRSAMNVTFESGINKLLPTNQQYEVVGTPHERSPR